MSGQEHAQSLALPTLENSRLNKPGVISRACFERMCVNLGQRRLIEVVGARYGAVTEQGAMNGLFTPQWREIRNGVRARIPEPGNVPWRWMDQGPRSKHRQMSGDPMPSHLKNANISCFFSLFQLPASLSPHWCTNNGKMVNGFARFYLTIREYTRWRLSLSQNSTSVYTRMQRQMTYPREISWSIMCTMFSSSTKMKTSGEMCGLDT